MVFRYLSTNEKAIKNISFEIKGNTMAAFVGHSGAGKAPNVFTIFDPQGSIHIDNQNA